MTIAAHGFELVPGLVQGALLRALIQRFGAVSSAGCRGLLADDSVGQLARSPSLVELISGRLGAQSFPVRAVLFDKSPSANWLVPWHQDLTIAVVERADLEGYGPWSVKDEIPHVQPPTAILDQMLTLRLALDDCAESNGPLQVMPGSHLAGRLSAEQIASIRAEHSPTTCLMSAGDALLMRPLLLHASSRSTSTAHRRVLHIEYACCELPAPLRWHLAA